MLQFLDEQGKGFSALQRAEIAEIGRRFCDRICTTTVSVLFNEPKLLKFGRRFCDRICTTTVSVLFNEPKLLKL